MNGKRYDIDEGTLTIGRSTQADITLPSNHLSRQHAQLKRSGGNLVLQDMASMNGTFVNGKRIKAIAIKPGDQIRFDRFTFLVDGPSEGEETIVRPPKSKKRRISASKMMKRKRPSAPHYRIETPPIIKNPKSRKIAVAVLIAVSLLYLIYVAFFS